MSIYIVITKDLEVKYAGTDINTAASILDDNEAKQAQIMDVKNMSVWNPWTGERPTPPAHRHA